MKTIEEFEEIVYSYNILSAACETSSDDDYESNLSECEHERLKLMQVYTEALDFITCLQKEVAYRDEHIRDTVNTRLILQAKLDALMAVIYNYPAIDKMIRENLK